VWTRFQATRTFTAKTSCGFDVEYVLVAGYEKTNAKAFKAGGMLEESNREKLLSEFHGEVLLPLLRERGRSFRLIAGRDRRPALCHISRDGQGQSVHIDISCRQLLRDAKAKKFRRYGCEVRIEDIYLERLSDKLVQENYKQMKLCDIKSVENSAPFKEAEEAFMVALLNRQMEIEKALQESQTNQTHKGDRFTVKTRAVGLAAEISWKIEGELPADQLIRGFRAEGGFAGNAGVAGSGVCIAEARRDNATVQSLREGTDYFFTFLLVRVGADGGQTVLESLRFSLRIPTQSEISRIEQVVSKAAQYQNPAPPKRDEKQERIDRAMRELVSFVEFDESLSALEKRLIDRIGGKEYTTEEKEEKIERLRAAVESLRLSNDM